MKLDRRRILAALTPGVALGLWLGLGAVLLRAALDPAQRAAVDAAIGPLAATHGMLVVLWWLIAAGLAAWVIWQLFEAHVAAPARLADATRVMIGDATAPDLVPSGGAPSRALTEAINGLAGQRRSLQQEMAWLVSEASRNVAEQRDQLGALMAELDQSVVVCNMDGRILLYNERARQLFRRLSRAPGTAAGAELIGLGRSIYGVIDRALIAHASDTVGQRLAVSGDPTGLSARFVTTTPAGHLLRVNMAAVRPAATTGAPLAGYVLLLDDITDDYEGEARRDQQILSLTEGSRASLANMQVALDVLEYPDLDPEQRDRLHTVVRDEMAAMSTRLTAFADSTSQGLMMRWQLQEMRGADLLAAARRRIEADHGPSIALDPVDDSLWLHVDSFALIEAIAFLAGQLCAGTGTPDIRLRLATVGSRAHLDLIWTGKDIDPEDLRDWQNDPMQTSTRRSPLSVRAVAERHGGEVWIGHDHASRSSHFRFLLPLASSEPMAAPALGGSRPEYYDFDLFARSETSPALDDQLLTDITYTVFDTETTGLAPLQGDEIIQIGATRIVKGKLLRGECYDQLVDPDRSIPEVSTQIHGISPEMVRGKPLITAILPAFHAFVSDTVLVGHNVAFDMSFLRIKEEVTGVVFDQPVLDTLLLSSVVHPTETSHSLEAIAARLGAATSGRHTALGDALSVAEVFLKLLPLLTQRGILTLAQAREASRDSYYARLKY